MKSYHKLIYVLKIISSSGADMPRGEQFMSMHEMVSIALGEHESHEALESNNMEESPNEETKRFYNLWTESNKLLFEGAKDSKVSICVRLLACKSNWNVPDQCLEFITQMLLDITPINKSLPKSYYDAKRLVSKLGLEAKRIDCSVDGCMLFYSNEYGKNDGALVECKFCHKPRHHDNNIGTSNKKQVPVKEMFYLPIISRLQRMFASMQTAGHMTWHHENKRSVGVLRHPSDGEAWKPFDHVHPDFAIDPCNVRLGLCFDGFNPYIQASPSRYSCWPIIITPYNLPPEMCMSKAYMFLSCFIPDPSNPKTGIDVYLEPMIDDLKKLWSDVLTYDVSRKQNFMMKAALM